MPANRTACGLREPRNALLPRNAARVKAPTNGPAQLMAVLEPGSSAPAFRPLPGATAAPAEAEGPGRELLSQLVPAAALTLGVALTAAPSVVLGGLVGTSGESVVGALLETVVYGEQGGGGQGPSTEAAA
jgi:hypothetical protein